MKKIILTIAIAIAAITLNAQTPPSPNGDGSSPTGGGHTPVGGGAPIAGGIGILLVLGTAYGAFKSRKVFQNWKKLND